MTVDDATRNQIRAADPRASTWLAANAGSGKTRVLTDRVARLLLLGVPPEHILCLTYTKAAATEMQNRLFKRLGAWAMLDAPRLAQALQELGLDDSPDGAFLENARTLFARAIEAPGGLRIQTIHSFCATLLRRFPLEAGVSPQFTEMEDRAADLLRAEILDRMASGDAVGLVEGIAPFVSGDDPAPLLAQIARHREAFLPPRTQTRIWQAYGLAPDADETAIAAEVFLGSEDAVMTDLCGILAGGSKTDVALGQALSRISGSPPARLRALETALLTAEGQIKKRLGTKLLRTAAPYLFAQLDALAERVFDARDKRLALEAAERDLHLHRFAGRFLPAYEREKTLRGWLDFDDLITRTQALLDDPGVADWVLYRLDGGIDHILVDEAQDTAPVQWRVIERLAREFTSGDGARSQTPRTIFVVGDKKQSIYSFQGADPSEFDRMCDDFAARLEDTGQPLQRMVLPYSFRSAKPVLTAVDAIFDGKTASGFTPDQTHIACKEGMPGRVDLWPIVEKASEPEQGDWFEPVDRISSQHHDVVLAERIADFVARAIETRQPLPVERDGEWHWRPVQAGDFLVLVRRRGRLFAEIIRACKARGVPIAGADRLKVMAELAVRDVVALLGFLATPEDDLSLATVLRSPLVGLSEQTLFDLAHRREDRYLWPALRARAESFPEVMALLTDLRAATDFLRPYDLIERILTRHRGRQRLIGRLGPEAEDGINALLQQALAYEATEVPSLTGFLHWVQTDDLTIKRAPESAGDVLRVMTVHGSKGLEAPIVIMPDCAKSDNRIRDTLLRDGTEVVWKQPLAAMPERQRSAAEAVQAAALQERDRLLYVGMTRAEKWLIVAAAGDLATDENDWYSQVARGLASHGAPRTFDFGDLGTGDGWRLEHGQWPASAPEGALDPGPDDIDALPLPHGPSPAPHLSAPVLSPSDLGGAKALAGAEGDSTDAAKDRGTRLHMLLEHLAPLDAARRPATGRALLGPDPEAEALLAEVLGVLDSPDLPRFFAASTLAEVAVTADLPGLGRIHGVIDRLIVGDATVVAVDFKSNRTVPDRPDRVPEGLLRQMGAYATALAQVYPGRQIETGILWTVTAHYMPLPHALVTQALGRAPTP